mgnify:CR=1 FL=1|tara:strand:+ start:3396 stop:3554 length:159 start_codon:yes stop_codon:yes gene_type:complete
MFYWGFGRCDCWAVGVASKKADGVVLVKREVMVKDRGYVWGRREWIGGDELC